MPSPALPPDDARRARGYRVANALSYVLNPLILPPVAFALAQWQLGAGLLERVWTFAVSFVFFAAIPVLYVLGMVRRGETESLEVRGREQRTGPYVVGVFSCAVGLLVLALTVKTGLRFIVALACTFPLNLAGMALINLRWKISIHMASLAGFCGILLFVALTAWRGLPPEHEAALTLASVIPLLFLLPLLMWARVRVGAHTPAQVFGGAVYGLLVPLVELYVIVYYVLDLA